MQPSVAPLGPTLNSKLGRSSVWVESQRQSEKGLFLRSAVGQVPSVALGVRHVCCCSAIWAVTGALFFKAAQR